MKLEEVRKIIADGKIFSVRFIKRTNGEVRDMIARIGVKAGLQGGEQPYKPQDHDLLTVFDMQKQAYRNIPVDSIIQLKARGQSFVV